MCRIPSKMRPIWERCCHNLHHIRNLLVICRSKNSQDLGDDATSLGTARTNVPHETAVEPPRCVLTHSWSPLLTIYPSGTICGHDSTPSIKGGYRAWYFVVCISAWRHKLRMPLRSKRATGAPTPIRANGKGVLSAMRLSSPHLLALLPLRPPWLPQD